MKSVDILGFSVSALTQAGFLDQVGEWVASPASRPHRIVTLNAEMAQLGLQEPRLARAIRGADLVVADGAGVMWAARHRGTPLPARLPGVELVSAIAERASLLGWSLYLLGAKPGVADEAARNLCVRYPGLRIAGVRHGYFDQAEEEQIVRRIHDAGPDVLFAGLGAPRQEIWLASRAGELNVPVAMGVGGSFDVLSGRVVRAPGWLQRLGLEWLYRLSREPRRWRRYLALPRFTWSVLRQDQSGRRPD